MRSKRIGSKSATGLGPEFMSNRALTPAQGRAYVLADNKLALNAGWDLEMLSLEIGELGEAGFDLSLTRVLQEGVVGAST
jgi:hypothetical protein